MSSHLLSRLPKQQVLWRTGAAMLLALLAAIFTAGTTHAAPPAQVNPCNQPGLSTIIDPAGRRCDPGAHVYLESRRRRNTIRRRSRKSISAAARSSMGTVSIQPKRARVASQVCLLSEISNVRLAYLIAKYPPDLDNNINMAARQAAVWHYSNGKNLSNPDATTLDAAMDAQVLAIYNALLAEVDAIDPNNPPGILRAGTLAMTIDPPTAINQLPAQSAHQITVTADQGRLRRCRDPGAGHIHLRAGQARRR